MMVLTCYRVVLVLILVLPPGAFCFFNLVAIRQEINEVGWGYQKEHRYTEAK